jgi:hypothetical protein
MFSLFLFLVWAQFGSQQEKQQFLLKANITSEREISPAAMQLTLDAGSKHDARAQFLDHQTPGENLRFDLAAYELDRALGLNLVTPAVERTVKGRDAVVVWWVDDFAMNELERRRKKIEPPDPDRWAKQMQAVRVFDELIANAYRKPDAASYLTTLWDNLLITRDWGIWITDHKRAFGINKRLEHPETLTACERAMLKKLRSLNKKELQLRVGRYLSPVQIDALEVRRVLLVKHFDVRISSWATRPCCSICRPSDSSFVHCRFDDVSLVFEADELH